MDPRILFENPEFDAADAFNIWDGMQSVNYLLSHELRKPIGNLDFEWLQTLAVEALVVSKGYPMSKKVADEYSRVSDEEIRDMERIFNQHSADVRAEQYPV